MKEKTWNIILGIILAILMIVAIVIVIINPNTTEKTAETTQKAQNEINETNIENQTVDINIDQVNEQEEKEQSMQQGGTFCKIDNKIVFYEDTNETIYMYDITENKTSKIATLENGANKIYFDGENIYFLPYYYRGRGIYKVDLQGNIQKISEESSLQLWLTEDKIYFVKQVGYDDINQNPQGTLCVMDKDGTNIIQLADSVKNYFYIQSDKIYYTTQDRKMYAINIDGTNPENLVNGRRFVINTSEKYIIYMDYANQEAKHILNLETKEDSIIGYFGFAKNYQGKTYINTRKRLDDGSLENEFTLFEIQKNGTIVEIGKHADFGTTIEYIINGKAYIYNQQEGTYIINLENGQKESTEDYKNCRYFLGGYGYKIDDSNIEEIKVERIKL